jgi:hypothetical protein
MESVKTNCGFIEVKNMAIAGVLYLPELGLLVAWENIPAAKDGFFAISLHKNVNWQNPFEVLVSGSAYYGEDVTHKKGYRDLFPSIFNKTQKK